MKCRNVPSDSVFGESYMHLIDWISLFDEAHQESGASDAEISLLVDDATRSLSPGEIEHTKAKLFHAAKCLGDSNSLARIDPSKWELPQGALPKSYLEFLRWSNGGSFRCGEKWFDPIFRTDEVRGYMLGYDLPEWMPGVLPFAFDGGGTFYVFDMRQRPRDGEYPVLAAHAGSLGFHGSRQMGSTFLEACYGRQSPMSLS